MICPLCKKPVPFGLPMHMIAAHGEKSAEYQRETERIEKALVPEKKKGGGGRKWANKKSNKGQLQHPWHSKLS